MSVSEPVEVHFPQDRSLGEVTARLHAKVGKMAIGPAESRLVTGPIRNYHRAVGDGFHPARFHRVDRRTVGQHDVQSSMEIAPVARIVALVERAIIDHPHLAVEAIDLLRREPRSLMWPRQLGDRWFGWRKSERRHIDAISNSPQGAERWPDGLVINAEDLANGDGIISSRKEERIEGPQDPGQVMVSCEPGKLREVGQRQDLLRLPSNLGQHGACLGPQQIAHAGNLGHGGRHIGIVPDHKKRPCAIDDVPTPNPEITVRVVNYTQSDIRLCATPCIPCLEQKAPGWPIGVVGLGQAAGRALAEVQGIIDDHLLEFGTVGEDHRSPPPTPFPGCSAGKARIMPM